MYECGKLKKVLGNKFLFPVILEQCEYKEYADVCVEVWGVGGGWGEKVCEYVS